MSYNLHCAEEMLGMDGFRVSGPRAAQGAIIESGPMMRPVPVVKAIVDLRASALSALIERLDSTRPTAISFKGKPVPLGYLALDILINIVKTTDLVFINDCADDGLGACMEPAFYFRPDASVQEMAAVKAHWRAALSRRLLEFQYPDWCAK